MASTTSADSSNPFRPPEVDLAEAARDERALFLTYRRDCLGHETFQRCVGLADLLGQDSQFHLLHVGRPDAMAPPDLGAGKSSHFLTREGAVEPAIVEVALQVDADLIVMATAGHKSFLDALRGSTTETVLRAAKRALLAVPAE